jgi:hypothetical protein
VEITITIDDARLEQIALEALESELRRGDDYNRKSGEGRLLINHEVSKACRAALENRDLPAAVKTVMDAKVDAIIAEESTAHLRAHIKRELAAMTKRGETTTLVQAAPKGGAL